MTTAASNLEWYQQGYWPLVGAIALLVFTNLGAMVGILLQTSRAYHNQLRAGEITLLHRRLHEFYDPVYALLLINSRTFSELGPKSFPTEELAREASAKVWNQVRSEVILPNNRAIQDIVKTRSYLVGVTDDITEYMGLLNHISMYSVFQDTPTELYSKFQFPQGILRHVEVHREELIDKLDGLLKGAKP